MAKKITEDGEVITTVQFNTIPQPGIFLKTPWNHDRDAESAAYGLQCKDPTKTQQHLAKETEVAVILAKFMQTGEAPGAAKLPTYMDVDSEFDLQTNIVTGHQVKEAWEALPAAVRNILRDPRTFVDYIDHCVQTGDLDPLVELGLTGSKKPPETKTDPPPAAQEAPPPVGGTPAPTAPKAASEAAKS